MIFNFTLKAIKDGAKVSQEYEIEARDMDAAKAATESFVRAFITLHELKFRAVVCTIWTAPETITFDYITHRNIYFNDVEKPAEFVAEPLPAVQPESGDMVKVKCSNGIDRIKNADNGIVTLESHSFWTMKNFLTFYEYCDGIWRYKDEIYLTK